MASRNGSVESLVPTSAVELLDERVIQLLRSGSMDQLLFKDVSIDLGKARTKAEIYDENSLAIGVEILSRPSGSTGTVILNHKDSPIQFQISDEQRVVELFSRLYMTNSAQSGTLKLRIFRNPLLIPVLFGKTLGEPVGILDSSNARINPATEDTLAAQLDITLSALRDALRGGSNRTLTDIYNAFSEFNELSLADGTATGSTATTLTDTNQDWGTDTWANTWVRIETGTGAGQVRRISSNTSNTLTIASAWTTNPDTTSTYRIFGAPELVTELEALNTKQASRTSFDGETITLDASGGANDELQGSNIAVAPGKDIIIKADPNNAGEVWIRAASLGANKFPLFPNDAIATTLDNFNRLWFYNPQASASKVYLYSET